MSVNRCTVDRYPGIEVGVRRTAGLIPLARAPQGGLGERPTHPQAGTSRWSRARRSGRPATAGVPCGTGAIRQTTTWTRPSTYPFKSRIDFPAAMASREGARRAVLRHLGERSPGLSWVSVATRPGRRGRPGPRRRPADPGEDRPPSSTPPPGAWPPSPPGRKPKSTVREACWPAVTCPASSDSPWPSTAPPSRPPATRSCARTSATPAASTSATCASAPLRRTTG